MNYFIFIDIAMLVILVISLLCGLIRGFKKSLRRFVALLIPTLCLFIFLTPITKGVMKKRVDLGKLDKIIQVIPDEYTDKTYSINDAVSILVTESIYPDDPALQENSEILTIKDL